MVKSNVNLEVNKGGEQIHCSFLMVTSNKNIEGKKEGDKFTRRCSNRIRETKVEVGKLSSYFKTKGTDKLEIQE